MRTIAKALRQVSEGKASAQAEAAEWKRKYEVERARNLQEKHKESSSLDCNSELVRIKSPNCRSMLQHQDPEKPEKCCGKNGICSHEVLHDGEADSNSKISKNKFMRKASFRLSWGCNGSGQQKHDIVSFERGNITTAERSSKQISLRWESPPQSVLIMTKPNSNSVRILCAEIVRWLKDQKKIAIFVEPRVRTELLTESSYFSFVESWEDDEHISSLHAKVDLVITLGGDGTVLWISEIEHYRDCLDSILKGPISITLRHRLQCHVIRDAAKDETDIEETLLVLNEVTLDRGISSYLTNLECYCDSSFVTSVQGDGLIISTTSGSTAYSLATGGSMVHPQAASMFKGPVPPFVSFSLGSLGFMTSFRILLSHWKT